MLPIPPTPFLSFLLFPSNPLDPFSSCQPHTKQPTKFPTHHHHHGLPSRNRINPFSINPLLSPWPCANAPRLWALLGVPGRSFFRRKLLLQPHEPCEVTRDTTLVIFEVKSQHLNRPTSMLFETSVEDMNTSPPPTSPRWPKQREAF